MSYIRILQCQSAKWADWHPAPGGLPVAQASGRRYGASHVCEDQLGEYSPSRLIPAKGDSGTDPPSMHPWFQYPKKTGVKRATPKKRKFQDPKHIETQWDPHHKRFPPESTCRYLSPLRVQLLKTTPQNTAFPFLPPFLPSHLNVGSLQRSWIG